MARRDPLDPDGIKANLKTCRVGSEVIVYADTSSTNDIAWEYAESKDNNGVAIFAEYQAGGRGRGGSKWSSARGDSILCSIVLLDCGCEAELLTLSCAVATAEAIGRCGSYEAGIKWPNDIIINNKKVAGILLESRTGKNGADFVIGIGINCHQKTESFTAQLRGAATSIDLESDSFCDRPTIAKRLLVSIDNWIQIAEDDSGKVIDRWRQLSLQFGQRVTLMYNNQRFSGNCIGVDPREGLVLQLDKGGVRMFGAAHTSIVRRD